MFVFATPDLWDKGHFQATYIWLSKGNIFRSKVYTLAAQQEQTETSIVDPKNYPVGVFDGSSTGDAVVDASDVRIRPCAVYRDLDESGVFVLCDRDAPGTQRANLLQLIENRKVFGSDTCWFGFEQEYFIVPIEQDQEQNTFHYCTTTVNPIPQLHYNECFKLGIQCTGWNTEVAPNQFEFQICGGGVKAADDLIMARWVLMRMCEQQGVGALFVPKPIPFYNGSGLHTNFSTKAMRTAPGGWITMLKCVGLMRDRHMEHMEVYGEGNRARMTGKHETSVYEAFSWGVGTRNTSVRLQSHMKKDDKGYIEDRRPGSDADPYSVCYALVNTCVVDLSAYTNAVLEPVNSDVYFCDSVASFVVFTTGMMPVCLPPEGPGVSGIPVSSRPGITTPPEGPGVLSSVPMSDGMLMLSMPAPGRNCGSLTLGALAIPSSLYVSGS